MRSRHCSAKSECGYRGFAVPDAVDTKPVMVGHRIAARRRSWISFRRISLPL